MVTKRTIVCLIGVMFLFPVLALAKGVPQTYVIKKGDTLWGISQRFLKDPDYWPNLWSHNPPVTNPHLVYPGQKITLYDGRVLVVGEKKVETAVSSGPVVAEEVITEETITIKTYGGADGFVSERDIEGTGIIIDAVDNRLVLAKDDTLFLRMRDPAAANIGDTYSVFRADKTIRHPRTGKRVGYRIMDLGILQLVELNPNVATAIVIESYKEMERGNRIMPLRPKEYHVDLKRALSNLAGYVVAASTDAGSLAAYDIIFLDLGSEDGLNVGNMLYLARERTVTNKSLVRANVQLPDIFLGEALVLETQAHTSTALILKSREDVYVGDKVYTVVQ